MSAKDHDGEARWFAGYAAIDPRLSQSADAGEGSAAFVERRAAVFAGR